MDEGKVERMVVELPPLGRLFDIKHQLSRWACHQASVIVTRLRRRGKFFLVVALIGADNLVSSRLFLGGEDRFKESDPPII